MLRVFVLSCFCLSNVAGIGRHIKTPKSPVLIANRNVNVTPDRQLLAIRRPNVTNDMAGSGVESFVPERAGVNALGNVKPSWRLLSVSSIVGALIMTVALTMLWLNELRNARTSSIITRGLEECLSISSEKPSEATLGKLVHVQGMAKGVAPLVDQRFSAARLPDSLRFQSTAEVYEWKLRGSGPMVSEWTTVHQDTVRLSGRVKENPGLPIGFRLGTTTTACSRVELGGFIIKEEMVSGFHRFESAAALLPPTLRAHNVDFVRNEEDGYYYGRPLASSFPSKCPELDELDTVSEKPSTDPSTRETKIGDIRVRFLHVPPCQATVVAVHDRTAKGDSFVPYRPLCCEPFVSEEKGKAQRLEEGGKAKEELRSLAGTCYSTTGILSFCLCPCNAVAMCSASDVVTEEILFVSDKHVPPTAAFLRFVPRSFWRVALFRLLGCCLMYLAALMIISAWFQLSEGAANAAAITVSLGTWTMLAVSANFAYDPSSSIRWVILTVFVVAAPLAWTCLGAA
eukprot:TRINITY_DN31752_c0_g1_i1.p1 TRINITY_DN31752_c0_g1~~TRINITY_DN31752_c0_g1_i1.p1  ORF type:complete len:543 (-),score=38.89 TRINITY_DN31752_c0_g1_i1:66-1604(-)